MGARAGVVLWTEYLPPLAMAGKQGAAADADFDKGVAAFTMAKGGAMFEASIGGQKFSDENGAD